MTTQQDTINAFSNEVQALISRFANEWDLPYASAIGVLNIAALKLANEALENYENK